MGFVVKAGVALFAGLEMIRFISVEACLTNLPRKMAYAMLIRGQASSSPFLSTTGILAYVYL